MSPDSSSTASGPDGVVVVDKPAGWTSHDVVARTRRFLGTRKVGHAGTLDPMATGVLVLGVGRATRLLTHLVGVDKSYAATIRLGAATVTDDADGDVTDWCDTAVVSQAAVHAGVGRLTGRIRQVPSAVSAVKVDGRRSYARVRSGEHVDLPARDVVIHRFDVLAWRPAAVGEHQVLDLDVEVDVSSGTYVRALARDLGRDLGVGGHLIALRRTRVGPFSVDDACPLDHVAAHLQTMAQAAGRLFPVRQLDADEVRALRHGRPITSAVSQQSIASAASQRPIAFAASQRPIASAASQRPMAAVGPDGALVALVVDHQDGARSLLVVPDDRVGR
ncbi:MAG: tRNA pseudouridine(55) synthase TruB [Angustibacter sp.]